LSGNNRENEKNAKKRLQTFLKILKQKEKAITKANDVREWNELVHDLDSILEEYGNEIKSPYKESLRKILDLTDTSPDMMKPQYEGMRTGVEQAINGITIKTSVIGTKGLIIAIVTGAIAVTATAGVMLNQAQLEISNLGCDTINLGDSTLNIPGIPSGGIPRDSTITMGILPVSVQIDSQTQGTIRIIAASTTMSFTISNNVRDITYDGQSILGTTSQLDIAPGSEHKIVIRC